MDLGFPYKGGDPFGPRCPTGSDSSGQLGSCNNRHRRRGGGAVAQRISHHPHTPSFRRPFPENRLRPAIPVGMRN